MASDDGYEHLYVYRFDAKSRMLVESNAGMLRQGPAVELPQAGVISFPLL